ncbi:MAG TPA: hypothetical protein VHD55_02215 [Candidatus Paceibacterota bacterium]|nr:hypothetical protein [Candidatus Paceibacterota bacterium]
MQINSGFGIGDSRTVAVPAQSGSDTDNQTVTTAPQQAAQKIFKISDGPVTTATLVQTSYPTTTMARFVLQENGHAFDLVLDSAGAIPRALSNTTIPGAMRGIWADGGWSAILQYLDAGVVKSVFLGFPAATTTGSAPVRIKFLPDNIGDVAASPSGKNIVYIVPNAAGSDAYLTKPDGTDGKKLFSLPMKELLISWPAANTQLLWTKSDSGVAGAAFSVNASTGGVVPLLYAPGLTVNADRLFVHVVYQNTTVSGASSFVHDMGTGNDTAISFDPIPEKCIWSNIATTTMYCAVPLAYASTNYLDLWHQGAASMEDSILSFNVESGTSNVVTVPGGEEGGVATDIAEMAVSQDDRYLVFIKKGDRSLWGVRLTQ